MAKFKILNEVTAEDSFFDRQERIVWWDQNVLSNSKVLIAGAGALGNETLKNLALLGVRRFLICDFDEISTSNLSRTVLFSAADIGKRKAEVAARQCEKLILSSDPEVEWLDCDLSWELGLGRVAECSIVLSCLDNIEARKSLAWAARKMAVPFVDSGITQLSGHIGVYPKASESCYSCNLSTAQQNAARRRYSCDDVKRKSFAEAKVATVQISSAIISAIQCQEAVKILMGEAAENAFRVTYDGINNTMSKFSLLPDQSCAELFHDRVEYVESTVNVEMTLTEALEELEKQFGNKVCIDLSGDRSFTKAVSCRKCGKRNVVNRPTYKLTEDDLVCSDELQCDPSGDSLSEDTPTEKEQVSRLGGQEKDILSLSLRDLGIPDHHVITIDVGGEFHSVLLNGTR